MTTSSNFWLQDIPRQLAALDAAALRRVAPELKAFCVVLTSNICDYIYNRAGATGIFFCG